MSVVEHFSIKLVYLDYNLTETNFDLGFFFFWKSNGLVSIL